ALASTETGSLWPLRGMGGVVLAMALVLPISMAYRGFHLTRDMLRTVQYALLSSAGLSETIVALALVWGTLLSQRLWIAVLLGLAPVWHALMTRLDAGWRVEASLIMLLLATLGCTLMAAFGVMRARSATIRDG
ncbi:MAG: hypothetical protein GYB68_07840, partial [Chloroflexi bacterium]|nr:hypothetical protein [Chloroflexota bacterium]